MLEMRGISKQFPGVRANDRVDLQVGAGEIRALLGENGAGKTTLMNILYGLYTPDEGAILLDGRPVTIASPKEADVHGIGMIHQHFMLVPTLTVVENVVLGLAGDRGPVVDFKQAAARLAALSRSYGLEIDPWVRTGQLSVGMQQRVEILKALYRKARLLILDEPSSVLTPRETRQLFQVLRKLKHEGCSVIFISHKLDEVLELCDTITVMRAGRAVDTLSCAGVSQAALARLMVGSDTSLPSHSREPAPGEVVLSVEGVHATKRQGLPALRDISFQVRRGEIFGIAGVDGNGQEELAEVLAGLRPPTTGRVLLEDRQISGLGPRRTAEAGVGFIPANRNRMGIIRDFNVAENLVLKQYHRPPVCRRGLLDLGLIAETARRLMAEYRVRAASADVRVATLSGGNQQKVVLARELSGEPDLIIAAQPTQGLDIGAAAYVEELLIQHRNRGAAVILISTELERVLALSDRIGVLFAGELMGIRSSDAFQLEEIGLMMAGKRAGVRDTQEVAG